MKRDFKFYAFEQYNFGIRFLNFLNAIFTNFRAAFMMCIPVLAAGYGFHNLLYSKFGFEYGFWISVLIYFIVKTILDLIYIFVRKGVYLYSDGTIVIQNGYFANFRFLGFSHLRYSIQVKNLASIDIDNRYSRKKAWETAFLIPVKKDYIVLTPLNKYRTIFAVKDNFAFFEEIQKIQQREYPADSTPKESD